MRSVPAVNDNSPLAELSRLVAEASTSLLFTTNGGPTKVRWTAETRSDRVHPPHHVWRPSSLSLGARERRQMVHACRALRMQIKAFEEEFSGASGHSPRGAERAPLASTYRQYRGWKRDIRDHAAAQIQAMARRRAAPRRAPSRRATKHGAPPAASLAATSSSTTEEEDAASELGEKKRRVKKQLKDYDFNFMREHGRMPTKAEKEPIRDLYEVYHAIKAQLNEQQQQQQPT